MTDRQKGILAPAIVLVAWGLSSVFVKYLIQQGNNPHTQNFYRFAAGTLAVKVCATMLLTTPLGTLLISHWLFKEQVTPGQLVAGGALTLLAKEKPVPPEVAQAAEAADA